MTSSWIGSEIHLTLIATSAPSSLSGCTTNLPCAQAARGEAARSGADAFGIAGTRSDCDRCGAIDDSQVLPGRVSSERAHRAETPTR